MLFESKYIILRIKDESKPPQLFEIESFHIYKTYLEAVEQLLFTRRYNKQSQDYHKVLHGTIVELVFEDNRYAIVEMIA